MAYEFSPIEIDSAASYVWTIDSAQVSTQPTFTYQFPAAGYDYTVNLSISLGDSICFITEVVSVEDGIDSTGCPETFNYEVDPLNTLSYQFSTVEIDSAASYVWTIDSAQVSTQPTFTYQFPSAGDYQVNLSVSLGDSITCSISEAFLVEDGTNNLTCPETFNYQVDSLNTLEYSFGVEDYDTLANSYNWYIDDEQVGYEAYFSYVFPQAGIYNVDLSIEYGDSSCVVSEQIEVSAGNLHISGSLFADLIPVVGGTVSLYKMQDNQWSFVAACPTDIGKFAFDNLTKGAYLVYSRGNESIHQVFIPTYFVNGVSWEDAYTLNLYGSAEGLKITLIRSESLSSGQGGITARMDAAAFDSEVVLLTDRASKKTLKWTVSHQNQFAFDQLPFGAYQVTLEKPSSSYSFNVDLTESQPNVEIDLNLNKILSTDDENGLEISYIGGR